MDEKKQILLEEWKDIRETLRYFGAKRFAQLTVFIAGAGFLFDAFLKQTEPSYRMTLAVIGVAASFSFFMMERGSVRFWRSFAKRGKDIETEVGDLKLMSESRPAEKFLSATNATYAVYIIVGLLSLFALSVARTPSTKDVTDIVAKALNDAPTLAAKEDSQWALASLQWDAPSHSYQLTLVETGTQAPQEMNLTIDARNTQVTKIVKLSP